MTAISPWELAEEGHHLNQEEEEPVVDLVVADHMMLCSTNTDNDNDKRQQPNRIF